MGFGQTRARSVSDANAPNVCIMDHKGPLWIVMITSGPNPNTFLYGKEGREGPLFEHTASRLVDVHEEFRPWAKKLHRNYVNLTRISDDESS